MTNHPFSLPYNPDNSNLPFGQPHYPQSQVESRNTEQGSAPTNPPPSKLPTNGKLVNFTIEPDALKNCLYHDTYIQLVNRNSFWFHPTYIDHYVTSGFRWNGNEWIPWGIDLNRIVSFQCV
ncbi:collagen-like protein [Psychrobacillus sp. NPDC058041]|uniref:collagen-like protein n=1 Tax=Psychrobacillus sp. NPDC058041 TaxID=3346310 RepID=UPI0036DB023A